MQALTLTPALVIQVVTLAFTGFVAWNTQKSRADLSDISLEQARVKAELVEHQYKMQIAFDARIGDLGTKMASHESEDKVRFEGIGKTLNRIDGKLDKISQ